MGHHHSAQLIDCAHFGHPKFRGRTRVFFGAAVLGLAAIAVPVDAAPAAPAVLRAEQEQSPLSNLTLFLDLIIRLLGGDPQELADPRLSLTTKLNIVRGQYETYGIPEAMTAVERQQLLDAILSTHLLLMDPEIQVQTNVKAVLLFDSSLQDMWHDLGGPPGVLDP
jgi:hypothetical protein